MNRYRFDKAENYTRADLKLLNHRCNRALRKCKHSEEMSVQDRITERIQAAFDSEVAGGGEHQHPESSRTCPVAPMRSGGLWRKRWRRVKGSDEAQSES